MPSAAVFSWHTVPPVIQTMWAGSHGIMEAYAADPASPLALLIGPPGQGSSIGSAFELTAVQTGAQTIPITSNFALLAVNGLIAAMSGYSIYGGNIHIAPEMQVVAGDNILVIPQ